jgi:hypothetical protein
MRNLWIVVVVFGIGCGSAGRESSNTVMIPYPASTFSIDEVGKEALKDASKAIAEDHVYVCDAGTIAIYTPGISEKDKKIIANLPHRTLPSGCTEPLAFHSITYAKIFNQEILRHLKTNF